MRRALGLPFGVLFFLIGDELMNEVVGLTAPPKAWPIDAHVRGRDGHKQPNPDDPRPTGRGEQLHSVIAVSCGMCADVNSGGRRQTRAIMLTIMQEAAGSEATDSSSGPYGEATEDICAGERPMKSFGGWTGFSMVLILFLMNELLCTRGSALYVCFPFVRLFVIPAACLLHIFCTFATTTRASQLVPAAISAAVLAYQFLGPPLRILSAVAASAR